MGPPSNISTYFEDTLETEPTAYLPSRLPMPQATEKARNARSKARGPRAHLSIRTSDDRESAPIAVVRSLHNARSPLLGQ
jgi:hypothetical protein